MSKVLHLTKRGIKQLLSTPWKLLCFRWRKNYESMPTINGPCRFTKTTFIGQNCHFNGLSIEGKGKVTIGKNFHSGKDCLFLTDVHDYDNGSKLPYGNEYIVRDIEIGQNVWIGSRVIVLGGVVLGEGCIIQAGSVVTKSIPAFGIAGGSPAAVFKTRDIEHYKSLANN